MKNKRIWVFLTAILIGTVAFFASLQWPHLKAVFGGISASIIASLIFWILTDVLQDNSEREYLSSKVEQIDNLVKYISGDLDGLIDIRKRDDDSQYWIDFANLAEKELTLSGRTLTRWLDDGKEQEAFTNALQRIVKKSKQIVDPYNEPIRLVIYSDEGLIKEAEHLEGDFLESLKKKKNMIKEFLYGIWNNFSPAEKTRLAVYEVTHLPYLYCNNGNQCVTGTYFDNFSEKMRLQIIFRCGGDSIERTYTNDFNTMIKKSNRLDLTKWNPKNSQSRDNQ